MRLSAAMFVLLTVHENSIEDVAGQNVTILKRPVSNRSSLVGSQVLSSVASTTSCDSIEL